MEGDIDWDDDTPDDSDGMVYFFDDDGLECGSRPRRATDPPLPWLPVSYLLDTVELATGVIDDEVE